MPDNEQQFTELYMQYSDDALRAVAYHEEGYEGYARAAATGVLISRHRELFRKSVGGVLPLRALMESVGYDELRNSLRTHGVKESRLPGCRGIYDRFLALTAKPDDVITLCVRGYGKKGLNAWGATAVEAHIELSLLSPRDWVNLVVREEDILRWGAQRLSAVCLIKMAAASVYDTSKTPETNDNPGDGGDQTAGPGAEVSFSHPPDDGTFLMRGLIGRRAGRKEEPKRNVHPWARFFARYIDYSLIFYLTYFTLKTAAPALFRLYLSVRYISLSAAVWMLIEAALLCAIGTTPGKWLLKVSVRETDGTLLRPGKALVRSLFVWVCGCALQIGCLSEAANLVSYAHLTASGRTLWDAKLGLRVKCGKLGKRRMAMVALLLILPLTAFTVYVILKKVLALPVEWVIG